MSLKCWGRCVNATERSWQSLHPPCPQKRRRNHQLLIPVSMDLQILGENMNSKSTENQGGIKSLGCERRSSSITTHCATHGTWGLFFFFFFFHAEGYLGRGPSPVAHRKSVVLPIIRCCNGLWPRRNTREKGKLHAQLA